MEQEPLMRHSLMTKTILLSPKELSTLRANTTAWQPLIGVCDGFMDYEPDPMIVFSTESSYNATGHTENKPSDRLSIPAAIALRQALCYQLTGDTKYATKAQYIIDQWYKTLRRIESLSGQGVIGFHFLPYIVSADWVRDVNGWDSEYFGEFLNDIVLPQTRIAYKNNIASWWCALTAGIHAYNDNYEGLLEVRDYFKEQIGEQVCITKGIGVCASSYLKTNGVSDMSFETAQWSMPDEITRSNTSNFHGGNDKGIKGISYSHFGMLPWTLALEILFKEGINLYETTQGRYFQNVFNKMVGWVKTPSTFPYANKGTNTPEKLLNVKQCSYFAPLVKRFKASQDGDQTAINDAIAILDDAGGIQGDRWQLDLMYRGKWNPPSGFEDEGN